MAVFSASSRFMLGVGTEEGFDPASNDYYDALDSRMKNAFPHRFPDEGATRQNRSGQTVAGVSRSKGTGRGKKVRLSPSQVTIAKRLGVPLEEYAKQLKNTMGVV